MPSHFPNIRVILFDLDGTLVDTIPDLADSLGLAMKAMGMPAPAEDTVRLWVGNGVTRLLKRAVTGEMNGEPDDDALEHACCLFKDAYAQHLCVRSRVYPDVIETLAVLQRREFRMGVVTNKPQAFTKPLLNQLDLTGYFGVVLSADSLPVQKPDPTPVLNAMEKLQGTACGTLLVGDSSTDIQAARAAGMPAVAVSYGYNHGRDIAEDGPDAVIDAFAELPGLLEE